MKSRIPIADHSLPTRLVRLLRLGPRCRGAGTGTAGARASDKSSGGAEGLSWLRDVLCLCRLRTAVCDEQVLQPRAAAVFAVSAGGGPNMKEELFGVLLSAHVLAALLGLVW